VNAQWTADIALFSVRQSDMAGAGAGVFLAQSSALPPEFLITGNFSLSQVINYYLVIRIRW
jgi:hypothetical protein